MAKENPKTCVFSVSRIPSREDWFVWIGPLVVNKWVLFTNKATNTHPKSLQDLKEAVVGTYNGDASKHIDYWATGKLIGQYYLKKNNVEGVEVALTFSQADMYLG